ncbi:MAG: hypothetical protein JWP35_3353 [Caulobacter sp.]|nr:hypothetical protein [Caulobacter sp.]
MTHDNGEGAPGAPETDTSGMGFVSPIARGRSGGGRKSHAPGVERIIIAVAALLAFAGAFLDDPDPTSLGMMLFLDKLVIIAVVIAVAANLSRRGPPKRWLGPTALLVIVGAWVGGGLLRDPIQKAGYFPMTSVAVSAQVRDLMPWAMKQADTYRTAAATGAPVPAVVPTGRKDEAGRYLDVLLTLAHDVAVEQSAFRRECAPYLGLLDHAERLAGAANMAAAHAALAQCRAGAVSHRAGVMARLDAMPHAVAVFRNRAMREYVENGLGDVWRQIRPQVSRTWDLQVTILDIGAKQLAILETTRWAPQSGAAAFYSEADRSRFNDLVGKVDLARSENERIVQTLQTRRNDMLFSVGLGGY